MNIQIKNPFIRFVIAIILALLIYKTRLTNWVIPFSLILGVILASPQKESSLEDEQKPESMTAASAS